MQLLPSYQSPAGQYPPSVVGNPYQQPYVQAQPYYLAPGHAALHDQQPAGALGPTYDYYPSAGGGRQQRRRNGYQASSLNDQYSPGGSQAVDDDGDEDVVDYVWKIAGFSECSQTCGGGEMSFGCDGDSLTLILVRLHIRRCIDFLKFPLSY